MGADALPREYEIRDAQRKAFLLAAGLGLPTSLIPVWASGDLMSGLVKLLVSVLVIAIFGWIVFGGLRCVTRVQQDGIMIRGFLRTRRLAWSALHDIRAEPNRAAGLNRNAPDLITYAYGLDGKRVQLLNLDSNRPLYEDEVERVKDAWQELRGAQWRPSAAAEAAIRRHQVMDRVKLIAAFAVPVLGVALLFLLMPD